MPAVSLQTPKLGLKPGQVRGVPLRATPQKLPFKGATLRADMAAELNRLETQAAVLERDARNARAILIEQGLDLVSEQPRRFAWEAARSRWMHNAAKCWRACAGWTDWTVKTAIPYIATGFRLAKRGAVEATLYCTFAGATIAVFTLAILMFAPPD